MRNVRTIAGAAAAIWLILLAPSAIGAEATAAAPGSLTAASFHSATLSEEVTYNVYLPAGYETSGGKRYPVLYLLHGRGDSMSAWTQVKGRLDEMIGNGEIPATIAIMPDARWSSRASYYVDSEYTGADPGRPVETAFTKDLVEHVDATYRTLADRDGRVVGGYSMGGYGAIRYSLAHPDLFAASIVLSPAVYFPTSPKDSSTREFGAFGKGNVLFVDSIYRKLNYPATFDSFAATGLPLHMFIAVGDDEFKNTNPADYTHDLDFEAHVLFNKAVRVPNLSAELRVVNGGHDWDVWSPEFAEGARYVFQFVGRPRVTPMKASLVGTTGEERAGGVAVDAAGNVYEALAAEGSVDGQPYIAAKDVVLIKYGPTGTKLWTRQLGTDRTERAYGVALDAGGNPIVTGYTQGNLDGAHAGNTTDDAFVVKFDASGNRLWLTQFGAPSVADRGYALTTDPAGPVYVTGYTRGALGGPNQGDKDLYLAKLDGATGSTLWLKQVGSTGEDKAWGVAVSGAAVYVAGMTGGALGTSAGAIDGFLARFDSSGNQLWLQQFGTPANDEVWSLAADAAGNPYIAGYSAGDFAAPLAGDKDIIAARFDPTGTITWRDQLGTIGNDKGAGVALDGGNVYVTGFTDGNVETNLGHFDVVLTKYGSSMTREWTRQFGTTEDDGADIFAEFNLYLATYGGKAYVSGLTLGETATQAKIGNGDVFLATFDAQGVNQ